MTAYYNEFDPKAAAWLRELIAAGHVAPGVVDERSITDVSPADLAGFTQVHLFAGIGGWSVALRLAGWPDDRPCWTGSCPCQPFSLAGHQAEEADPRDLWPRMRRLVAECAPPVLLGEQVAGPSGLRWLARVRVDLETLGYAVGDACLPAAGASAPHKRDRLYWAGALAASDRPLLRGIAPARQQPLGESHDRTGVVADLEGDRWLEGRRTLAERPRLGDGRRVGDAHLPGPQGRRFGPDEHADQLAPWARSVAVLCTDGKARRVPVEPALFPLAHGVQPHRVVRLRGAGNAIVPPLAARFVMAFMQADAALRGEAASEVIAVDGVKAGAG